MKTKVKVYPFQDWLESWHLDCFRYEEAGIEDLFSQICRRRFWGKREIPLLFFTKVVKYFEKH